MGERGERNGVIIFKIKKKYFFKRKNSERTICLILTSGDLKSRFDI